MDEPKGLSQTRGPDGRYIYTPESAQRDAAAADLRAQRYSYQRIADELGYNGKGDAWRGVQRAMKAIVQESAERLIRAEAAQLDELYVEALEVLQRDHLTVSHGKIIYGEDGEPLLDDGPRLQAIDRLVKIRESFRKLHGLDAATKTEVSGGVRYEIVGVDMDKLR
ncbi:hypothetical protein [Streptomyces cucumeris]|uniref:hypothetical protein n=1 Tax=Streptomyces cucumeris TaxID=2962890 RepID=UPI003D71582D